MKRITALLMTALLSGCGTRPPLPPECEGTLSPINAQAMADSTGAIDESRSSP